jgi:hypothetical protein
VEPEPVVMVLGTGAWRWVYEAVMVTLAVLVVVLLPFENEGWILAVNLAVWGLFVADYVTRLALSTDRRAFFRRNIVDLLAIMPADFFRALRVLRLARPSVSCVPAACWLACSGRSAVSPRPTGSAGC